MATQLTRKELKQDKFVAEVGQTVDFFTAHRKESLRYGSILLAVILIVAGIFYYRNSEQSAREQALGDALALANAPIGSSNPAGGPSFPNAAAKDQGVTKAFNSIVSTYGGSEEAYIAEYYIAGQSVDAGKFEDARGKYLDVADHASANYASLAKLALAQIYAIEKKNGDAEKLLKDLMDHPTDLVSKSQATIAYAKLIGPTQPAEARKLLTAILADKDQSSVSQIALSAINELPQQ